MRTTARLILLVLASIGALVVYDVVGPQESRLVIDERVGFHNHGYFDVVSATWKPWGFCSYQYTSSGLGKPYPNWVHEYQGTAIPDKSEGLLERCRFQENRSYALLTYTNFALPKSYFGHGDSRGVSSKVEVMNMMQVAREQLKLARIRKGEKK